MDEVDDILLNYNFIKYILKIFKIIFIIMITAHWIACFYHLIR